MDMLCSASIDGMCFIIDNLLPTNAFMVQKLLHLCYTIIQLPSPPPPPSVSTTAPFTANLNSLHFFTIPGITRSALLPLHN